MHSIKKIHQNFILQLLQNKSTPISIQYKILTKIYYKRKHDCSHNTDKNPLYNIFTASTNIEFWTLNPCV